MEKVTRTLSMELPKEQADRIDRILKTLDASDSGMITVEGSMDQNDARVLRSLGLLVKTGGNWAMVSKK